MKINGLMCQNCRIISHISHPSKVMMKIILNRLQSEAEDIMQKQAGFRAERSSRSSARFATISAESLPCLHRFQEDLWHAMVWSLMGNCEEIHQWEKSSKIWIKGSKVQSLFNCCTWGWFRTTARVWQEGLLSITLVNILEKIMCEAFG